MSTVLVMYEGVLQARKDKPIRDGFMLVHSLCMGNRVLLATSGTADRVNHQLRTERLQDAVADVLDNSLDLPPLPLWQRQIEVVRSRWPLDVVLSSDPAVIEWSVEHGLIGLYFAHPGFNTPPYRPEVGQRSWESLLAEMESRL